MTKKNFIALAGILNAARSRIQKDKIVELARFNSLIFDVTDYLKTTNSKFNQRKFIAAIYKEL